MRKSAGLYLQFAVSRKLKANELTPNMLAAALFPAVIAAGREKFPGGDHHIKLATRISGLVSGVVTGTHWPVDTEGNPGTEVLDKILRSVGMDRQLGLDDAAWATTKVFIDEHLIRDRNRVAHGEGTPITKASFLERLDRLIRLLDLLADQLVELARAESYKLPSP